ncbi:hypothetical protein ASF77_02810 [Massilia sp. Leaf139]|nr:hypothetical protein ASF77_02810 [Massilia sp. Leaf139]
MVEQACHRNAGQGVRFHQVDVRVTCDRMLTMSVPIREILRNGRVQIEFACPREGQGDERDKGFGQRGRLEQ